ncbi:MAG: hypothetical protein HQM08_19690 [Candidatus Riflebacteria bacterium]|nr:hypothetical protein [Candidatus Riflebacteria bacterium]
MARFKFLLFILLFISCSSASFCVDLFDFSALPEFPIAMEKPSWAIPKREISIKRTSEEMFREWRDGNEINRFDGSRSQLKFETNRNEKFGLNLSWKFQGQQTWFTKDSNKLDPFDLNCREEEFAFSLKKFNPGFSAEIGKIVSNNKFQGTYGLSSDIISALGNNPEIHFQNPSKTNFYRFYAQGSDLSFKFSQYRGDINSRITTSGIRMDLNVPLKQLFNQIESELSFKRIGKISPYLRYSRYQRSGDDESYKNGKFAFGDSFLEFENVSKSIGFVCHSRHTFFAEISQRKMLGDLFLSNNLITLDPIFLFATNEVITRVSIPQSVSPKEFRIGTKFDFRKSIEAHVQYGFSRLDLSNLLSNEKIFDFRNSSSEQLTQRNFIYNLHRLSSEIVFKNHSGAWKITPLLMIPTEVSKEKAEETTTVTPSSGGPAQASPPKASSKIRGGWQVSIEKTFTF